MLIVLVAALAAGAALFLAIASRTVDAAARADADAVARRRFAAAFAAERLPADVVVETYEMLSRRVRDAVAPGALHPSARLAADLGLTAADVEDVALLVAARCDARLPHAADLDALDREVHTAADLVRYVARFAPAAAMRAA